MNEEKQGERTRPRRTTANYGTKKKHETISISKKGGEAARNTLSIGGIIQTGFNLLSSGAGTSNYNMETTATNNNTIEQSQEIDANMETETLLNKEMEGKNTPKNDKGKAKEVYNNDAEINEEEDSDSESVLTVNSFQSEHEEWRKMAKLEKYKAWVKVSVVKGKNLGEKIQNITSALDKNIITIRTEKNRDDRELYIAIYFGKKEDMEKACEMEIEGKIENDKPKLVRTTITQNRINNKEKGVKFWDIPVGMREQEFKHMLNHKFGKLISCTMSTRGMWSSAIAYFDDPNISGQILSEWSQTVGEESCRVSIPSMTFTELKNRGAQAVKLINLPPDMSPRELHVIIAQMGAKTCYFPRNLYGKKKRMAIATLESEEGKRELIGQTWKAGEYMIKIVDIKTKTCHRCHAEEHLVLNCPIAKRQKEINERKTKDFEKYGYMYKTTRPRLYQNLRNQVGMRTEYSDAVKRNVTTIKRNTGLISNQEDPLKNIMNMLETIKQDIVEIKKQTKNIDERVQYLEEYAGHNLEDEVDHMIEDEEEEENTTEKGEKGSTEETKKSQETQMEQLANTVKMLAELIPELKKSNDESQERLSRIEQSSILSKHREQTKVAYSSENQQF